MRDRTNRWGRVVATVQKTAEQCTPKNTSSGNSGENLRAATEAMHSQETENMGWGWNSVVHSKNDKEYVPRSGCW